MICSKLPNLLAGLLLLTLCGLQATITFAEESSSTSRPAVMRLSNGDHITGHLVDSTENDQLVWRSPAFATPFRFPLNAIESVNFPVPNQLPQPEGDYCFELADGDMLFGSLVSLQEDEAILDIWQMGRLHVKRSAIRRMHRWNKTELIYFGPSGLNGWQTSGTPGWHENAGHLLTEQNGAILRRDFGDSPQARFEIELSWTTRPDFEIAFGVNSDPKAAQYAFRLEVWENELVLQRETQREADVVGLQKLATGPGRIHLLAFLDQPKGRMLVFSSSGQQLADMTVATNKSQVFGGLQLTNRNGDLRLESLRIGRWNGEAPHSVEATGARIHQIDGTVVYGLQTSFDPDQRQFIIKDSTSEKRISEKQVQDIYLAQSQENFPRSLRVVHFSGSRISGELVKVEQNKVWLKCPGIREPLPSPLEALQALALVRLPIVTVTTVDATAAEPGPNDNRGTFAFTRNSTAGDLTIHYTTSGTATSGSDYAPLPGAVTIPSGKPTAWVTFTPLEDDNVENSETVDLAISSNSSYSIGTPNSATATIADGDISFLANPNWVGSNNTTGGNDFGWRSTSSNVGEGTGEIGGTLARSQVDSFYADTNLPTTFNLTNTITASGKFTVRNLSPGWSDSGDSGFFIGHFSKTADSSEFIGLEFKETQDSGATGSIRVRARYQLPGTGGAQSEWTTVTTGGSHYFNYTYDPNLGANGRLTVNIDWQYFLIADLTPEERDSNPRFDAFGLASTKNLNSENTPAKNAQVFINKINYSRHGAIEHHRPAIQLAGRLGRIELDGTVLKGCLVDGKLSEGGCLVWQPRNSGTTSVLKPNISARVVYRDPPVPPQVSQPANEVNVRRARAVAAPRLLGQVRVMLGGTPQPQSPPRPVRKSGNSNSVLHLRCGDTIPCTVTSIDEQGVNFKTTLSDATFVRHNQIKVLELMPDAVPVQIATTKRERLLTLPRMQRDNPPTQLIRSIDGDYLRARLLGMDEKELTVELRLEPKTLPRDRVARIIWLHSDELEDKAAPADSPDQAAGAQVQSVRADGNRMTFFAEQMADSILSGRSDVLGACHVDLKDLDELIIGPAIKQAASMLTFHGWKLKSAAEPLADDDNASGNGDTGQESPLVGKPAPAIELDLVDGKKFRLKDHKDKVVVLDFWASWCGPCLQTMPQVDQVAREFAEQGVELVAINLQETGDQVKSALERLQLEVTVALDRDGRVAERYGATSIPQTVIIDREGKVVRLFVGGGPRFDETLRNALKDLLPAKPPTN